MAFKNAKFRIKAFMEKQNFSLQNETCQYWSQIRYIKIC